MEGPRSRFRAQSGSDRSEASGTGSHLRIEQKDRAQRAVSRESPERVIGFVRREMDEIDSEITIDVNAGHHFEIVRSDLSTLEARRQLGTRHLHQQPGKSL